MALYLLITLTLVAFPAYKHTNIAKYSVNALHRLFMGSHFGGFFCALVTMIYKRLKRRLNGKKTTKRVY
jgi:hypothetical protein